MTSPNQLSLFASSRKSIHHSRSGSFVDNMKLPIHRWFRYSAGFSAEWVEALISTYENDSLAVLDPFAGSGTTVIAADHGGVSSIGLEAQPFVGRIAKAKLEWTVAPKEYSAQIEQLLRRAQEQYERNSFRNENVPSLLKKAYSREAFCKLESLRLTWEQNNDGGALSELAWLTITAILRVTSHAGTASWQYVLPKKTKAKVIDPFEALQVQATMMAHDIEIFQRDTKVRRSAYFMADARDMQVVEDDSIDLVITSPPYTNNYDYADATRLEMTFWREVERWSDLQEAARRFLVRSCTQHARAEGLILDELLADPYLEPIHDEITPICLELSEERHLHGGKKQYHLMVAAYFADMGRVWNELRRVCKEEADICFILGDSAPYGIYVPVINWHAALAEAAGFRLPHFNKLRDRNIKWRNRTHTKLLTEGELWITPSSAEENNSTMERKGSPGHKLGQMIGNFFEEFFAQSLQNIAISHELYLDTKGLRSEVRGNRTKVTWRDNDGTPHDLDYVLERGGALEERGRPAAFIELAWRRYTKHSRNKAGEIEGALYHLGKTFPGAFLGAIVGGEWSQGSLDQMETRGISVLHVPFDDIVNTFATKNIDLRYAEKAPDVVKWQVIDAWSALADDDIRDLQAELARRIDEDYSAFLDDLDRCLGRYVTEVRIWYLYGEQVVFRSIEQALQALDHQLVGDKHEISRYEIEVYFSNDDNIKGTFHNEQDAYEFLLRYK